MQEGSQRSSTWNRRVGVWQSRLLSCCLGVALLVQASACTLVGFDKRSVYQYDHSLSIADDAFRRSLDAFGFAMVEGNRAEILNNGDEIFPAMTRAIREAKRTVNLESYIFKDDRAGKIIAQALIDAARRGVEVRVLVDGPSASPADSASRTLGSWTPESRRSGGT